VIATALRRAAIFRLRAVPATNSYGEPSPPSWANPERVRIPGAFWQPAATSDDDGPKGTSSTTVRRVFVPGDFDLAADDRVEIDGDVWRVDGHPTTRRGLIGDTITAANLVRPETR
jgi:hypothetical protein